MSKKNVILYRSILFEREELEAAKEEFPCFNSVVQLPEGATVIARYSVLPYYQDVEADVVARGAKLLNTYRQHRFVADLGNYVEALGDLTPRTYPRLEDVPDGGGPFVLKGETNSRRSLWKTHMFAQNKREAITVASRLMEDSLIGQQHIYVRDYVPLESFMVGLDGVPVAREFRFFVLDGKVLSGGFYWSSHVDTLVDMGIRIPRAEEVPPEFLQKILDAVGASIRFYAMDVAKTQDGRWIVVELNDGQQAGLSCCSAADFYKELRIGVSRVDGSTHQTGD